MPPSGPSNLLEALSHIQNAPNLQEWWEVVTGILEEQFDAVRAELAVPSNEGGTEVKRWAQLASFISPSCSDSPRTSTPSPLGTQHRPRLGSRHSFQGYPSVASSSDPKPGNTHEAGLRRPGFARTSSSENTHGNLKLPQISPGGAMLSPTSLKRHFLEPQDSQSENLRSYEAPQDYEGARVYPDTRSLDMEHNCLIIRTDVTRCLKSEQGFEQSLDDFRSIKYLSLTVSKHRSKIRAHTSSRPTQKARQTHSTKVSVSGIENRPSTPALQALQEARAEPSAILAYMVKKRKPLPDTFTIADLAPFLAGTLTNIRRTYELESKLSRAQEEGKKKMNYLHTMSHELRTPLNGMIGNMQLMSNSPLIDNQQDWVQGALNAARGMNEVLDDILDIAKAEARMLSLSYEWFRIRSTMEEVMETLGSKANEKRLELCYEIHDSVPVMARGDGMRIRQVLLNLVGNAVKFTRRGEVYFDCRLIEGPTNAIRDKVEEPEITLAFRVVDTGCGFSEENAKLLFRPYSQINNSATRANKGTGLGLTLCKQMVELHGGKISATSEGIGHGSTFTFTARFRLPTTKDHPNIARTLSLSPRSEALPSRSLVASPDHLSIDAAVDVSSYIAFPGRPHLVSSKSESLLGPSSLALRNKENEGRAGSSERIFTSPADPEPLQPSSYDILIVCPQEHTLRTTKAYIEQVLPKSFPSKITINSGEDITESLYVEGELLPFTHMVLQLPEVEQVLAYMDIILNSVTQNHVYLIIVTDQQQELAIKKRADYDYAQLAVDHRLTFILKPTKPPKFMKIFDPHGKSATSIEYEKVRNKDSKAQMYQRFKEKLAPLKIRALAVEDNSTNMKVSATVTSSSARRLSNHQQVLCTFLTKFCGCEVVEAADGNQCTDLVYSHPPLYYSVIIVSLQILQVSLLD